MDYRLSCLAAFRSDRKVSASHVGPLNWIVVYLPAMSPIVDYSLGDGTSEGCNVGGGTILPMAGLQGLDCHTLLFFHDSCVWKNK